MEVIYAGIETFFDSPGDILAVLSIVALIGTGILFLIDARLGSVRTSLDGVKEALHDMRQANEETHADIKRTLAEHAASPLHNRRRDDA